MKKITGIIVEKGALGNASKINITGIQGSIDHVPVNINFDPNKLVGYAKCKNTPEGLMAEITVEDEIEFNKMFPAIGGVVKKSHVKDGVRYIEEFELTSISISAYSNADHSIKSIEQQNEEIKTSN